MNDYTSADRARLTYQASGTVPRRVLECGCAETVGGLHRRDCPVWVNVGPDLRNRRYVRRDAQPDAMLRAVAYGELIDERFAHKTCAYGNCESLPDPGSSDGVCTYHRADTERYDDGEAWPR